MRAADLWRLSIRRLVRNRRKSGLAVLAVAIGVASFFLISAVGSGVYVLAEEELSRLGIDGLSLRLEGEETALDPGYAQKLAREVPGVWHAMPFRLEYGSSKLLYEATDTVLWQVGSGMVETMDLTLLHGRGIDAADIAAQKRVAVVDAEYAFSAYRRSNIVGKSVRLLVNGHWDDYEIVGVIASQTATLNAIAGSKIGTFVYLPYTAGGRAVDQIAIRCREDADSAAVAQAVEQYMTRTAPTDGTYIAENITGYLERVKGIVGLIRLLTTAIGSISLVVAAVGVMNGMLAGLDERRREIGILLSVGAIPVDLVRSMLLESVLLCLMGGMIGAVFGLSAASCVCLVLSLPLTAGAGDLAAALVLSTVCGLLCGVIPAAKAAKTDPAKVLRQE